MRKSFILLLLISKVFAQENVVIDSNMLNNIVSSKQFIEGLLLSNCENLSIIDTNYYFKYSQLGNNINISRILNYNPNKYSGEENKCEIVLYKAEKNKHIYTVVFLYPINNSLIKFKIKYKNYHIKNIKVIGKGIF